MTGQQWFGVVIEGQNGRRRFRHVNTAVYSSWESLGRVVAVELAALGAGARVVKLEECSPIDHLDGLTVTTDDWWFNVRPSNTEPLLRLNVEGQDTATMERVRDEVLARIRRDT